MNPVELLLPLSPETEYSRTLNKTIKNAEIYLSFTRDAMVSDCLLKLKSPFSFASYNNFVAEMSILSFDHFS